MSEKVARWAVNLIMMHLTARAKQLAEHVLTRAQTLLYQASNPDKARVLSVKRDNLTYLTRKDLMNLYRAVKEVEAAGIPGVFVEAGCALGGSSIAIGTAKSTQRTFRIYDAFGLIPPPSEKDGVDVHARYEEIKSGQSRGLGGDTYYGYVENLQEVVTTNLARYGLPVDQHNIRLIKGYFEDTLYINEPVAFAHIDCDWYASVMTCLLQIAPNLSPGGVMVFDDYSDWSGCRMAVDEYFRDKDGYRLILKGRKLHVVRERDAGKR